MMRIRLFKPFYESVPYMYLVTGGVIVTTSLSFNYQFWPVLLVAGLGMLLFGLLNLRRRKDFREGGRQVSSRGA